MEQPPCESSLLCGLPPRPVKVAATDFFAVIMKDQWKKVAALHPAPLDERGNLPADNHQATLTVFGDLGTQPNGIALNIAPFECGDFVLAPGRVIGKARKVS